MKQHQSRVWLMVVCLLSPSAAQTHLAAQRPVRISRLKWLDTSPRACRDEPAYVVSLQDGTNPLLEFAIVLKPPPDASSDEEVPVRIDLLDADGKVVEMVDATQEIAHGDPPWIEAQSEQNRRYTLLLTNRRPKQLSGSRFKIRASIDSSKTTAKESQVFRLYWLQESNQLICKSSTDSPDGPNEP